MKSKISNLFFIAFILMSICTTLVGVFFGSSATDLQFHYTYFVIANFDILFVFTILIGMFAFIYYFYPRVFRKKNMNETLGKLHFWLMLASIFLICTPMGYLSRAGVPRRYYSFKTLDVFKDYNFLNQLIKIVFLIFIIAQLIFIFNFFYSLFKSKEPNQLV